MNSWQQLKNKLDCACYAPDAWRCARNRHQHQQIACHCPCHRYIEEPVVESRLQEAKKGAKP
jgi:hypothetical protein